MQNLGLRYQRGLSAIDCASDCIRKSLPAKDIEPIALDVESVVNEIMQEAAS